MRILLKIDREADNISVVNLVANSKFNEDDLVNGETNVLTSDDKELMSDPRKHDYVVVVYDDRTLTKKTAKQLQYNV